MSDLEILERLTGQLREALLIIEEQAALLEMYGVEALDRGDGSSTLPQRREAALQAGRSEIAEGGAL